MKIVFSRIVTTFFVLGSLLFSGVAYAFIQPPADVVSANAGPDQTLRPLSTQTTVSGSSTGISGFVIYYTWTKLSGSGMIVSPTSAMTDITNLDVGTATFRFTATNNTGQTAYDDVNITVLPVGPQTSDCMINSFTANPTSVPEHTGATTISWTTSGCDRADIFGQSSEPSAWDRGVRDDVNDTIVYGPPDWDFVYGTTGFYSFTLRVFNSNTPSNFAERTVNVYVNHIAGGGGGVGTGGSGGSGGGTSGGTGGGGMLCPFGTIGTSSNCLKINIPSAGVRKASGLVIIKDFQKFLNWNLGSQIQPLVVDGKWGTRTNAAIRLYQKNNQIKIDGSFGRISAGKAISALRNAQLYK